MFRPIPKYVEEMADTYRREAKGQLPEAPVHIQIAHAIKTVRAVKEQPGPMLFRNHHEKYHQPPGPFYQRNAPEVPLLWRQIMDRLTRQEMTPSNLKESMSQVETALEAYRFTHRIEVFDPEEIPETLPQHPAIISRFKAGIERILADEEEEDAQNITEEIILFAKRAPTYAIEVEAILEKLRDYTISGYHQIYFQERGIEQPSSRALSAMEADCRTKLIEALDLEKIIPFERNDRDAFCTKEEEQSRYERNLQQYQKAIECEKHRLSIRPRTPGKQLIPLAPIVRSDQSTTSG